MFRRVMCVLAAMIVSFAALAYRTADLSLKTETAGISNSGLLLETASVRGTVYDCNMNPLTNAGYSFTAIAKPTQKAASVLEKELDEAEFEAVKERILSGKPVTVGVSSKECGNSDIKVISTPERYLPLACHIIGYTDYSGKGVSGAEKAFDTVLSAAEKRYYARVETDAHGRVFLGEEIEANDVYAPVSGVMLTIDRDIQQIVEDALDSSGSKCAAAVVIDVNTGAIRACVSRPYFDQCDIASALDNPDSPLINRAFLPFSVGSVFKPVVAAAALENGIGTGFSYECTGSVTVNGVTFNCHKHEGHGKLDMKQAVANSCNTYFIALAQQVGAEKIVETASAFSFGQETVFADGMKSSSGNLPSAEEIDSLAALANISFGQGALTATPVQICAMYAAIANGGIYVEPYLAEGTVAGNGTVEKFVSDRAGERIISQRTANILKEFLIAVVEEGSGSRAKSETVICGGKTATAQTGRTENEEEIFNAWFAGFFPADRPRYAVVILKENGGEGALSCAPVFRIIAENISEKN